MNALMERLEPTAAESPDPPDPGDLDALAERTPPVAAWEVDDDDDATVDLAALASSTSSAPPEANSADASLDLATLAREPHPPLDETSDTTMRAPAHVEGLGRGRLIGAVIGIALGSGFGALVFGANAEVRPTPPTPASIATVAPPVAPTPTPAAEAAPVIPAPAVAELVPVPEPLPPPTPFAPAPVEPAKLEVTARPPTPTPPPIAAPAPGPEPELAPEPAPEPTSPAARDLDTLLANALPQAAPSDVPAQTTEPATEASLPHLPARADVQELIAAIRPALEMCAMGQSGFGHADVVVRNDGTVAGVHVTGAPFAGTPSGQCMESMIRPARFPPFAKPQFHFRFPIAIP